MKFDDQFIEELKSRLKPSEVIGKSVKLRRNGREFVGLSPFTNEKTPSFYVNDQKGFYHDFSSGKHGDIISFLQETQRLSFTEALEALANQAGMSLPQITPEARAQDLKKRGLSDWMNLAARFFTARLNDNTPEARAARDYLKSRGFGSEEIAEFGLGYAPKGRTSLKDALLQAGATASELVDCGLLIEVEGHLPYDRFRERIMFPIEDARGQIISFGGRALNPEEKAKYLNGPETVLFHKGGNLYGLPRAVKMMQAQAEAAILVVVEGYMDVLACLRAHIPAVAPLGTALTEDQIDILWRRHSEPILCFDGDKAGQRAAYRALDRALPKLKPGKSFRVALLTAGKDPDDILRTKGSLALREALSEPRPFVDVLFRREFDLEPLDTPERKAGFKKRLKALAAAIEDKDLADAYRLDLLHRFDQAVGYRTAGTSTGFPQGGGDFHVPQSPQRGAGRWSPRRRGAFEPEVTATIEGRNAAQRLSQAIDPVVAALAQGGLDHPAWFDQRLEELEAYGLGDEALKPLCSLLVSLAFSMNEGLGGLDSDALKRHVHNYGLGALSGGIQAAALKSGAPFLLQDIPAKMALDGWLATFDAMTRLTALERALTSATSEAGSDFDVEGFSRMKVERDGLRKSLKSGEIFKLAQSQDDPPVGIVKSTAH